jgi:ABC-2 type transport system permease protein
MASNSVSRRVARKELSLFFASPVAWLYLASFAAVSLFVFFWVDSFFARNIADVRPLFEWMPVLLIFLGAALTMRMWSDERRNGTLEHVLTQPQSLWRIVLGKFRACCTLLSIALLCTLPLPLTVALIADLDWGPVAGAYLAALLLGSAYISVGLYVSARTDNPIVSLIGTVILCGLLYLVGSVTLTGFFPDSVGEILRALGSGSRFESITRGVLDARDLVYYLSLMIIFLGLNIYELEKERWAKTVNNKRHRQWRAVITLLIANCIALNLWLAQVNTLRVDLTEGNLYTLSQPSEKLIEQLQEPLVIRGYFSAKTHPLLSPLVPQLRDLLSEYAVAGKDHIRIEFIDPALNPELEREANERFGIHATPFQVADRYQSALVNSYFNLLIQYGDEHQTLGFADLIEVKTDNIGEPEVLLRNPEFDISRAIKRVLYNYQVSGQLFENIKQPLEFIAYVSDEAQLPPQLMAYKASITEQLKEISQHGGDKFSVRFIEPEANNGIVARQIRDEWGFKPMVAALSDEEEFFFYLTLADRQQVVQIPTDNFDPTQFRIALEAALKRFAKGLTKTVALAMPEVNPQMAQYKLGAPIYTALERAIGADYSLRMEELGDGSVSSEADILVVAGPHQLDQKAVYAIDQYLMRGGTVVLATSPFSAEISGGEIRMQEWSSGLEAWLEFQGIKIGKSLVLDENNASFPAPVKRQGGGYEFQDVQMIDYPFFIDLRKSGLSAVHPVTRDLPQLTMAWASPLTIEQVDKRRLSTLLRSSTKSWLSEDSNVMPSLDEQGLSSFRNAAAKQGPQMLGAVIEGRFNSWFADTESVPVIAGSDFSNTVLHSPESARLVIYSSNDFLDDQILSAVVTASGTQYLGPVELLMNTLDWSLQDDRLLQIRSRGHFNRTLPPMQREGQMIIEYSNYALSVLLLLLIATVSWLRKRHRRNYYARGLSL